MQLKGSDPTIETLISKIDSNKLELQPDFQRGEVWGLDKKQALIDTILRGWHVPPIHIIVVDATKRHEVLDGQQRLTAIRDFKDNRFPFDGYCDPISKEMQDLDGLYFKDLPETYRNEFDDYAIRQFLITDYEIGEPGELFHRLNQQARLTPSEKRNAFFGPVRAQIKELVSYMDELKLDKSVIGFSNSRMAYDDVLSKTLIFLERRSIREKVTENNVTERYRDKRPFDEEHIEDLMNVLSILSRQKMLFNSRVKFNKATLLSWLLFISRNADRVFDSDILGEFIYNFEYSRFLNKKQLMESNLDFIMGSPANHIANEFPGLLTIFNDRATSRVADASSVVLRDVILNFIFHEVRQVDGFRGRGKFSDVELGIMDHLVFNIKRNQESEIFNILIEVSGQWGDWREAK